MPDAAAAEVRWTWHAARRALSRRADGRLLLELVRDNIRRLAGTRGPVKLRRERLWVVVKIEDGAVWIITCGRRRWRAGRRMNNRLRRARRQRRERALT